ncbi:MAG: toxin-antitoxin system HicB family antitoxin [Thiolinea sp.]
MAAYPLRLPRSLKEAVNAAAERDGTSMNQFITIAVAEKLAVLNYESRHEHPIPYTLIAPSA